ncbi:MAG: PP2C family serine/threonine-protein phosphatase [Dehalococcoidia bacterium]
MAQKTSPGAATTVVLGALSHVGQKRSNNQDSMCSIAAPNTLAGTTALVAVADGMGGHKGGEVASALAIQGVVTRLGKSSGADLNGGNRSELMTGVVRQIHAEVLAAGNTPETSGMGTTLSIGVIENDRMLVGHVGDSRIYRLRAGQFLQLTDDHSWVADEVRRGNLTEAEAEVHPRRNLLSQAVGVTPTIVPMVAEFDLAVGDKIMLCSDGLHGLVSREDMRLTIDNMPPDLAVQTLVDKANEAGGHDNITVVIAEIVDGSSASGRTQLSEMNTITLNGRSSFSIWRVLTWPVRIVFKGLRKLARR